RCPQPRRGSSAYSRSQMPLGTALPIFHFVVQRAIAGTVHGEPAGADFQSFAAALAGMIQDVNSGDRPGANRDRSPDGFQQDWTLAVVEYTVVDRKVLEPRIAIS